MQRGCCTFLLHEDRPAIPEANVVAQLCDAYAELSPPGGSVSFGSIFTLTVTALLVVTWFRRLRWAADKPDRTLGMPDTPVIAAWYGGLRTSTINCTARAAYLELFDWGVRLHGRGLWRWLLPTWEVRYAELSMAQLIKFPIAHSGVLMRTNGPIVPLVFAAPLRRSHQILDQLEARGVPVDWSATRLRRVDLAAA